MSRWLNRSATAFHSIVLPPTPRLRSESNPSLPGLIVGIWRVGKSKGNACVLKSVRVLTRGPPSTRATRINSAALRSTRTIAPLFDLGEQPRGCISDLDEMVLNVLLGKEVSRLSLGCS